MSKQQWPNITNIFQAVTPSNKGELWQWAKLVGVLVAVAVAMRACAWVIQ